MQNELPLEGSIYVLKNDEQLGPFEAEEIFDLLEAGELSYEDICLREGALECERLRDILDWEEETDSDEDSGPTSLEDPPEDEPSSQTARPVLYRGHPSVLNYPLALLSVAGGITAGLWLFPLSHWYTAAGFGLAFLGLTFLSFARFTRDYLVTRRRIELIRGFFARSSNEVRITDIRSINVTCEGFLGMMGIGTVDFFTSGDEPEIRFEKIWRAKKIKGLVRRLQDQDDFH